MHLWINTLSILLSFFVGVVSYLIAIMHVLSVAFMFSIHTNKNELTVSFLVFEDEFMVNMHGKVTMGNETSTYREFKYKRRFIIINFISSRVNGSLVV